MEFFFILVKPALPDNVGAAARAMNTMGFRNLRLVNPCDHLSPQAFALAHGSREVLEKAELFPSLAAALKDIDFSIATTARKRHLYVRNYIPAEEAVRVLESKRDMVRRAALVFGGEESGLLNGEVEACDIITTVPLARPYPSLNLAQAVMVYAYLFSAFSIVRHKTVSAAAPKEHYGVFRKRLEKVFAELDIKKESMFHIKIMKRIGLLPRTELRQMHFFLDRLEEKLGTGGKEK
jgi:tRNA/rRNA methyltransferase